MQASSELAAMIGSRICHDLISPLGAIGNGLELIEMTGTPMTPELELIRDSARQAQNQIKLFRAAFGRVGTDQMIGADEIVQLISGIGGRVSVDWRAEGDHPKAEIRAILALLMCLEHALPMGGRITVLAAEDKWELIAEGPRFRLPDGLWQGLRGVAPAEVSMPAEVQFVLAPIAVEELGRRIEISESESRIRLRLWAQGRMVP